MADITNTSTIEVKGVSAHSKFVHIITPATSDDGDTIDVSNLFESGGFAVISSTTDGTLVRVFTTTITLPGVTDNEARTIYAIGF